MVQLKPFRPITRSVAGADSSALCYAKWHPYNNENNAAGTKVTAATIEVQANLLDFQVNGAAETIIGTYTGNSGADNQIVFADGNIASIQNLIDTINGQGVGHPASTSTDYLRRWRAGLGDFRPQFVIGAGDGLVAGATNALLGDEHDGLALLADSSGLASANLISMGLGSGRARRGGGQQFPDHFESDRASTTAGALTNVRASRRRIAEQPGMARTIVYLTDIVVNALFATTKIVTVYDEDGNTLFSESMGAAVRLGKTDYDTDHPIAISPPGQALFVEVSGTGAFTDGACSISGFTRIV